MKPLFGILLVVLLVFLASHALSKPNCLRVLYSGSFYGKVKPFG